MITKADILNMTKHILRRGKALPDRKLMHPYREWYIGLILMVAVLASGVMYGISLHGHFARLESTMQAEDLGVVEYKENIGNRVRERFETRAGLYGSLKERYVRAVVETEVSETEETDGDIELQN